jgi:hypothetical protein
MIVNLMTELSPMPLTSAERTVDSIGLVLACMDELNSCRERLAALYTALPSGPNKTNLVTATGLLGLIQFGLVPTTRESAPQDG